MEAKRSASTCSTVDSTLELDSTVDSTVDSTEGRYSMETTCSMEEKSESAYMYMSMEVGVWVKVFVVVKGGRLEMYQTELMKERVWTIVMKEVKDVGDGSVWVEGMEVKILLYPYEIEKARWWLDRLENSCKGVHKKKSNRGMMQLKKRTSGRRTGQIWTRMMGFLYRNKA